MADRMTKEKRSWNMQKIKSKNTKPEIVVRSLLHRMGFRFRLHKKELSGCPDIVLAKYHAAIFVNGCFWHQHEKCNRAKIPETNHDFWKSKLEKNRIRDKKNYKLLKKQGWRVIIVWQCELKKIETLAKKLRNILRDTYEE